MWFTVYIMKSSSRDHMLQNVHCPDYVTICCKMSCRSVAKCPAIIGKLPDRMHTCPEVLQNVLRLLESVQITTTPVAKRPKQYILMISTLVPVFLTHWYVKLLFVITWIVLKIIITTKYILCCWPPKFNSILKFCRINNVVLWHFAT